MNKKYYQIIIVLLIVLNVFSWRLWWEKPPLPPGMDQNELNDKKHREGGMKQLFDELELSEEQKKEFEKLRKEYFDTVFIINKEIDDLRRTITDGNSNQNDSIFYEMGTKKALLEKKTFMHFNKLREVCDDEQKVKFDTVHKRMLSRINRWNRDKNRDK